MYKKCAKMAAVISTGARACKDAASIAAFYGPLSGRSYFITGASSGFGLATARALVSAGGTVILACRPGSKAEAALAAVRAAAARGTGGGVAHLLALDLAEPASVHACVRRFEALRAELPGGRGALHACVLNAGLLGLPFGALAPGVEPALQTNLLGHALLHDLLRPALEAAAGDARLVIVASESHRRITGAALDLARELPPRAEAFDCQRAYAFSNLARILWARALARPGRLPYPVVSLHPACSGGTAAGQHLGAWEMARLISLVAAWEWRGILDFQSVEQGARTQTLCAVAPRETLAALNGAYLSGNSEHGPLGSPVAPSPFAQREDYADAVFAFVEGFLVKERAR